jgi:serine/threonine protein kinase
MRRFGGAVLLLVLACVLNVLSRNHKHPCSSMCCPRITTPECRIRPSLAQTILLRSCLSHPRFAIQLLQSLRFLKRERIIHCDLKPENVLLKVGHENLSDKCSSSVLSRIACLVIWGSGSRLVRSFAALSV